LPIADCQLPTEPLPIADCQMPIGLKPLSRELNRQLGITNVRAVSKKPIGNRQLAMTSVGNRQLAMF